VDGVWDDERGGATDGPADTPLWRDPLSISFRAHRQVMLLRLRWHERRQVDAVRPRRSLRAGRLIHRHP
jgi:hypothetical protein